MQRAKLIMRPERALPDSLYRSRAAHNIEDRDFLRRLGKGVTAAGPGLRANELCPHQVLQHFV
jgi:hypothetical protein